MPRQSAFLESIDFPLDTFQRDAIEFLNGGSSVLVCAPTGSGKTLVGEYALSLALDSHQRAFYTTPLKALSNQKLHDFGSRFGEENVGLLTGDNSIRPDAPIVVMTTEVLRNMLYTDASRLHDLRYVVLDEVHYLQDRYRGGVWEEVIVQLDPSVQLVCLSATVSNAEEFGEWLTTVRGHTAVVIEETRAVELQHLYAVDDRQRREILLAPTFTSGPSGERLPNPELVRLDERSARRRGPRHLTIPRRTDLVELLSERNLLPAIFFVFSRAGCDEAVDICVAADLRLTTNQEMHRVEEIVHRHTDALSDDELDALDFDFWFDGLRAGFASHHAGLVPPMKEAVEEAFVNGLAKVVFATETLSLGINMPAKTVVLEKLTKFTGERHENLTPGEYTQLAGRAGRRGIDTEGSVVVCWSPFIPFVQVATLASRRTYALRSSFRPTYNMTANLIQRFSRQEAEHFLSLSFAQFQADRSVVGMERQWEDLIKHRGPLLERLSKVEPELSQYQQLLDDAKSPHREKAISSKDTLRRHPLTAHPDLESLLEERRVLRGIEQNIRRLERRIHSRTQTLVAEFEQVASLLESWGYVSDWSLTKDGTQLARLYTEMDLIMAEALRTDVFVGLESTELAGVVACLVFESRGDDGPRAPHKWQTKSLGRAYRALEEIWETLVTAEGDFSLRQTRPPDPGLANAMFRWVEGAELTEILEHDEFLTGGDFVRHTRNTIDLLRQLGEIGPSAELRGQAKGAARAAQRGVVAASQLL